MLTILRKIRRSLIGSGPVKKYFLYAIGEIALVVIGILIALRINTWNEIRKDAELEKQYMVSMLSDLSKDRRDLQPMIEFGPVPVIYNDSLSVELQKRPLEGREKRIYHFLMLYTNGIQLSYYDRTISQLRNSGGFRLIKNQTISDAILDYYIHMEETIKFQEGPLINSVVNNDILINNKIYELYKVQHLQDSAIMYKEEINKVDYPADLKLLSYNDLDITMALNSMSSVRPFDEYKYERALEAFSMNIGLDSLIRNEYDFN